MKVSVILSVARQVEGEYCFCKIEKAHVNAEKLHKFLRENDLPRTQSISNVDCVVEYGVIEDIEVEDE